MLNDRPEIFWCDGNATSTEYSQSEGQSRYVVIEPNYLYEGEEKEQRNQEIESARTSCLSGISDLSDEYEKIKYIYTYLIDNVDYDLDAPDNQNIYSALVGKRSVCAGYAKSCQYLLQQLGIYCIYVTGQTTDPNGGVADHAWNIVQCNGQYYYVDTTWGDPIFLGEDNGYQIPNLIAYDYLCCSEKELEKTHMISTDYVYPSCQSENLNYYQLNGMYYDTYEPGILREVMQSIRMSWMRCTKPSWKKVQDTWVSYMDFGRFLIHTVKKHPLTNLLFTGFMNKKIVGRTICPLSFYLQRRFQIVSRNVCRKLFTKQFIFFAF